MSRKIGFLIPEFPGQTHIFFWRERQALAELGVQCDLVSTRAAPAELASHSWAEEARAQTHYLTPLSAGDAMQALASCFRAGPKGWGRSLAAVAKARDIGLRQRARMMAMILIAGRLNAIARDEGWNHVHVHSCGDAANIAMLAERLGGPSYSLTLHGPSLGSYGADQQQKWGHAAFGTVISRLLYKAMQEELGEHMPEQVEVAAMGVDLNRIRRNATYRPADAQGPLRVFCCARLNPGKGHDDLLKSIGQLRDAGLDVRLRIAGEDEQGGRGYHRELQAMIDQSGMSDAVTLLGAVSEDRVREELEAAHVFALSTHFEGVPVAVMEAMAMAMPVVVTNVGGIPELIDDGIDAMMVPAHDPQAMAEALRKVLTDPELAVRLAAASRAKIEQRFHHRVSAEAILRCLDAMEA